MRVVFVNRFFHPDESATSQLLTDLATELSESCDVLVVTSRQVHDATETPLPGDGHLGRIRVHRLRSAALGGASLWRKALEYLSFHLAVTWYLARHVGVGDVTVLKTDPPLLQLVNTAVIRMKGAVVVNWLQDLYPEIAWRSGLYPAPEFTFRLVRWWRDRALRSARTNVVVSPRMADYLASRDVANVRVISNWADERGIRPVGREGNPFRHRWNLGGRFVVMYSGNMGRVHAFDEIKECMRLLGGREDIAFVFVGDGAERAAIEAFVSAHGLTNVVFAPRQARDRLSESLGAADLHLISLKPGMDDLVLPSKLFGVLAAGRPAAFVGEREAFVGRLIRETGIGYAVSYGEGEALADGIIALSADPERRRQCGVRARDLFDREYSRSVCVGKWRDTIAGGADGQPQPVGSRAEGSQSS